jgi:hypothetical protein
MIKFDIKMPSAADLMQAAMAEVESATTKKAQSAAKPHGGVTVRFERTSEGAISAVRFQGPEAAVEAARAAIVD